MATRRTGDLSGFVHATEGAAHQRLWLACALGHLVRVGSLIYFTSKVGVWRSDGTASGTMLLFPATGLLELFTAGERLVIRAWDQAFEHYTLWLSDGTPEGTIVLRTHSPAVGSYVEVSAIGNRLVWTSFAGSPPTRGRSGRHRRFARRLGWGRSWRA